MQATIIAVFFLSLVCVMHAVWHKLKNHYHVPAASRLPGRWFTGSSPVPLSWILQADSDYTNDPPALAFPPGRHPKAWEPVAYGLGEVARATGFSVPAPVRTQLKKVGDLLHEHAALRAPHTGTIL